MQETWVQFLGQEDPLEKAQACASLVVQTVKNLTAMQETWVQFLGWEDPLEKKMTAHSSILVGKSQEKRAWQATVHGLARVGHDLATRPPPPSSIGPYQFARAAVRKQYNLGKNK